jgi:hypothetical protein
MMKISMIMPFTNKGLEKVRQRSITVIQEDVEDTGRPFRAETNS